MFPAFIRLADWPIAPSVCRRVAAWPLAVVLTLAASAAYPQPPATGDPMRLPPLGEEVAPLPNPRATEQAPTRLTLTALVELALQRNPTLAKAGARIEAARGEWVQVGLRPNPRIGYNGGEIGNEGRAGQQGGFVSQEIVTADKLAFNRNVLSRELDRLQHEYAAQEQRVITDVRKRFYEVLAAQRSLDLTAELTQISDRAHATSQTLLKSGVVSQLDVLQSKIEAQQARIMLESARNRHANAWQQLALVIGDPMMAPSPLDGDIRAAAPDLTWETSWQRLRQESPELAAAQASVEKARATRDQALANRYPNLEVQAGAQYDSNTRDTVANVQFSVPFPVYDRNQGAIRRSQSEVMAAEAETARVELNLQQRLAAAFEPYRNARAQVDSYANEILPDSKRSMDIAGKSYDSGEIGYLSVLTVQRTYFQSELAYLDALRQLHQTAASIEGLLLADSLDEAKR